MQIKSIIFDLDGLLINSEIVSFEIYKELLAQHQHNFTLENYAQNYSGRSSILNMENIIKEYRLPFSIPEGITHSDRIEEKYVEEGIALMNGARELLDYLKEKQYEISLASSSTRERAFTIKTKRNL
ncbi:HAD family hydrolase [Jeotgalibaca porci]|uniref:HAD family hydrolase n=1 Tax=Jeotgalibaca porci TaxID=1868793 RepID=UPI003F9031A3